MNIIDLIVVVMVLVAGVRGLLTGAARQLVPFAAAILGMVVGALISPSIGKIATTAAAKTVVSLIAFFATVFVFGMVGQILGGHLSRALKGLRLGAADSAVGVGVAIVSTLLAVWLLAGVFARIPMHPVSGKIHDSKVIRALDKALPPVPSVFSRLGRILNAAGFPDVFAGLEPAPTAPVDLPNDPLVRSALDAAGASTVRIVGMGCGGQRTGSGFIVEPGLVVTNAHVVAGIDRLVVEDRKGSHRATAVFFDPSTDLAVLRTPGLAGPPLTLLGTAVRRGAQGAVLGYPGGGPLVAKGAAVLQTFNAVGRDIYGAGLVRRNVYQLRSEVRPGNSGGPLVRSDGQVLGVVFSASATDPSIGYALTGKEVGPKIDQVRSSQNAVDTGKCAA